jgi:hypothetical protein
MAVTQISKIQIRRGLQENLPQLSSAEMGWSIDEQRLFIGNGTLAEGAPMTGVTEILTTQSMYSELALIESLESNVANIAADFTVIQSNIADLQAQVFTQSLDLLDNTINGNIASIGSATIHYTIFRDADKRIGTLTVGYANSTPMISDDYTESADIGVSYTFTGNMFQYTTTNTGHDALMKFHYQGFL